MSNKDITLTMISDQKQVEKNMEKMERKVDKLTARLKKMTGESKKAGTAGARAGKAMSSGMAGMARSAAVAVAGWVSINRLIATGRSELQRYLEVQNRIKETTLTTAEAELLFTTNLAPKSKSDLDSALSGVSRFAQNANITERSAFIRAATAVSSKGSLSNAEMFDALEAGVRMSPGDVSRGAAFTGSIMSLMRSQKAAGTDISAEEGGGFIQQVGKVALIKDPEKLAGSVGPAIAVGVASGLSPKEAGAMFAGLTLGMEDTEGRIAFTAIEAISRTIQELVPGQDLSFADRMDVLRQDPELLDEMIGRVRNRAKLPFRQMVMQEGGAFDAQQAALEAIPSFAEGGRQFGGTIDLIQSTDLQQTATLDRMLNASAERLEVSNEQASRMAILRDSLTRILGDTGSSKMQTDFEQIGLFLSSDNTGQFIDVIEERERAFRRGTAPIENPQFGVGGGSGFSFDVAPRPPSPDDIETANELGNLADVLRGWQSRQDETNSHLSDISEQGAAKNAKPSPNTTQNQRLIGGLE